MSFVNKYRSTDIYGELKVKPYTTGSIAGLLDVTGNANISGNLDVTGNLTVTGLLTANVSGTIENANKTVITADATDATNYITFVNATSGTLPQLVDSNISYNPSSNVLTVPNITGTCSNSTLATTSSTSTISTDATNANFYPTFVSGTTGNLGIKTDADYKYNPNTNTLNLNNLVVNGSLTGSGVVSNPSITLATTGTYYPTFVSTTSGTASTLNVDSSLFINAATNTLTSDNLYLSNRTNTVIDSLIIKARTDSNYTLNSSTLQFGVGSGLTCNFSNMVLSF